MKLLFLTSRFPYPTNKGDKLRAYYQIKEISKQNEIHLVSLTDVHIKKNEVEHLEKYCKSITILYLPLWRRLLNLTRAFFNNKPFQVNYFYTYSFQNKINKLIEEKKPDHIFCQLIRTALYMKDQHHIPSTLDYMDALSKGIERRIPIAPFWMKPILNVEFIDKWENLGDKFVNTYQRANDLDWDTEGMKSPYYDETDYTKDGIVAVHFYQFFQPWSKHNLRFNPIWKKYNEQF